MNWCQEADGGGRGFMFYEGAVCERGSPWLTGQKRCQVNVTGKWEPAASCHFWGPHAKWEEKNVAGRVEDRDANQQAFKAGKNFSSKPSNTQKANPIICHIFIQHKSNLWKVDEEWENVVFSMSKTQR